ncbi:FAD-dependent monooxygenase [Pseudochelatococcus sp. B33]
MTRSVAVIVGAGVAGLAAGWWLNRIGWDTVIVDRRRDLEEGGYMLGLSGPGYATASRMSLLPTLEGLSYIINENVYRDRHGRELLRLRYREFLRDLPYVALLRTDLVSTLRDALPDSADIRLGTTVSSILDDGGRAFVTLDDGTRIEADLVIGADGFRSATRETLFGSVPGHFEHMGYRFAVYDFDARVRPGSDFMSYTEPGHLAEYYALKNGRLAALHVWREMDPAAVPVPDRWSVLEQVTRRSHPLVRDMLKAAQAGSAPLIDSLTMVKLPQWSRGRVMLVGDAAHCLTLVSGQGAGMAVSSAELLADALEKRPVPEALRDHEKRLRPVIERLQQRSRRMASTFIPASPLAFHLRNAVLKYMPKAWLGRYFTNAIRSEIDLAGSDGPSGAVRE